MDFNDRRNEGPPTLVNPAVAYRAGLKRPDKPGQSSRATIKRFNSVHSDVEGGQAFAFDMRPVIQQAPVPAVVEHHVLTNHPDTILPRARFRLRRA